MEKGQIFINGRACRFEGGQTILEVAEQNGIDIPTLCHLKGTSPTGTCNVCVVEIKGWEELVRACSTEAEEGMDILTESRIVVSQRKLAISNLLNTGNHNCAVSSSNESRWEAFQMDVIAEDGTADLCPVWGDCRLQDLAYQYQVQSGTAHTPVKFPMETVNPLIIRDFSRCILCGRCVKACNEIQVNKAIDFGNVDDDKKIIAGKDVSLKDSDCVFCGECIQACPVGALVEKKARYKYRPWESTRIRTTCPYCGVGCQQMLHVQDGRIIKVTGVEDGAPNKGRLCVKGRFGYDFIYSEERLKTPLIREGDSFREASWDEALDFVADRFKQIISESGPDAVAGVSCARSINEDSYQMQKLFRAVFKTNNIDHCART